MPDGGWWGVRRGVGEMDKAFLRRAHIGRIVFWAPRPRVHCMYFEGRHLDTIYLIENVFRNDLEIVPGVMSEQFAVRYYHHPGNEVSTAEQTNV